MPTTEETPMTLALPEAPSPEVFLVDDEEVNLTLFQRALAAQSYRLRFFRDGAEVVRAIEAGDLPDVVVSDVMMPGLDGFTLCERIKGDPRTRRIPIVLVTGLEGAKDKFRGLEAGADDFLTKPFHPLELQARVRNLVRLKNLTDQLETRNRLLADSNLLLEERVRDRTRELEDLTIGIVAALEKANAMKDGDTGLHIQRVSAYSFVLARHMGLPGDVASAIRRYAPLHDVGKVGIPDEILKKEGKLTAEEYRVMQQHTLFGWELLGLARAEPMARNVARFHHERWDGTGYPDRLSGESIPMEARIVALADVYDALTTRRCYKEAYSTDQAEAIIRQESGCHFDPAVAAAFFGAIQEVHDIRRTYADPE